MSQPGEQLTWQQKQMDVDRLARQAAATGISANGGDARGGRSGNRRGRGGGRGGNGGGRGGFPAAIASFSTASHPQSAAAMAAAAIAAAAASSAEAAAVSRKRSTDGIHPQQQKQQRHDQTHHHHHHQDHQHHHRHPHPKPPTAAAERPNIAKEYLSATPFSSFNISPLTKKAIIEQMGYEFCSPVQASAIPVCLTGQDVLAKAKTGSGKTIAFMVPAIEAIVKQQQQRQQQQGISVLVLSPTRELAAQIYKETQKLTAFHSGIHAEMVMGGVKVDKHIRSLSARVPHVLVATPGRCQELAQGQLSNLFATVKVLVMDEADNLLDMGFRPQIDGILRKLPPKAQRQTLLFSATFPQAVQQLTSVALKPQFATVDCVGKEVSTNHQVSQHLLLPPLESHVAELFALLRRHQREEGPEHKVLVFFPTARITGFFCELATKMGLPVLEMHSRKSQSHRDKAAAAFRSGAGLIMFSSDVSARGVDYPDVTLVVQVGAPADKAQYIHRIGRTGRAGKDGAAVLLLCPHEASFAQQLGELPLQQLQQTQEAAQLQPAVQSALAKVSPEAKATAYQTWLGYYMTHSSTKKLQAKDLVVIANKYSAVIGCAQPPAIPAQTVGKMHLKGVPGITVDHNFRKNR